MPCLTGLLDGCPSEKRLFAVVPSVVFIVCQSGILEVRNSSMRVGARPEAQLNPLLIFLLRVMRESDVKLLLNFRIIALKRILGSAIDARQRSEIILSCESRVSIRRAMCSRAESLTTTRSLIAVATIVRNGAMFNWPGSS